MSLDKPIIELIEEYLANSSNPREHDLLSGIFQDTRQEYVEILIEVEKSKKGNFWEYNFPGTLELKRRLKSQKPISIEDLERKLTEEDGLRSYFYQDQKPRSTRYLRLDGFLEHQQFLGFPELWEGANTSSKVLEILREGELLLHKIIRTFLEAEGQQCTEIEKLISYRAELLTFAKRLPTETLFDKLKEEDSFEILRRRCRHYSQSYVRDEYFDTLLKMAKTKEELFFVVKHGIRCSCWPKAVRRLAQIKDLSPIEKIK